MASNPPQVARPKQIDAAGQQLHYSRLTPWGAMVLACGLGVFYVSGGSVHHRHLAAQLDSTPWVRGKSLEREGRRVHEHSIRVSQCRLDGRLKRSASRCRGVEWGGNSLLVRSARPQAKTIAAICASAAQIDPSIPLYDDIRLKDAITHYISDHILFARLLSLLAALALILATVGLCGLVPYSVAARIRAIGIRIALGAPRERVVGSVLREALAIRIGGVMVGSGVARSSRTAASRHLSTIGPK